MRLPALFAPTMASGKFISYLRVSTKRQGRSGLGIDAQREAVLSYLNGGNWTHVAEFVEYESGKRGDRPELARALVACRTHRATLVVAKLDRLARNAAFLLSLRDAGVEFVAVDMPQMNRMAVGIMAVVAEEEARMISERTKAALAAAKRRGVKLGTPNLTAKARRAGNRASAAARAAAAQRRAGDVAATVEQLRAGGCSSLQSIADGLNEAGIEAPRGGRWYAGTVRRLIVRLGSSPMPPSAY